MRSAALLLSNLRSIAKRPAGRPAKMRRRGNDARRPVRAARRHQHATVARRGVHRTAAPRARPILTQQPTGFAGMALH